MTRDYEVVRDPLWDNIPLDQVALAALDTPAVQRLRYVRQLGHAFLVYPGATHTRFEHALGAYHLTERALANLAARGELGRSGEHDLSRWILRRKIRYVPRRTIIVGISDWLSQRAKDSAIFANFDVRTIHNNINVDEFFPVDKQVARTLLGLTTGKKIVLVGAQDLKSHLKGFDKFLAAVKMLDPKDYFLAFFGRLDEETIRPLGFEYKNYGFLHDSISLRLLYSAADVFVGPSITEAFGKTIAESMACGTPVVCFDATGPKDIVDHQKNGYLARPFEAEDIANGIRWIMSSDYPTLCDNARSKVETTFDSRIIAGKYKELYEELVR